MSPVKQIRTNLQWTTLQLAAFAGCAPSGISVAESGATGIPEALLNALVRLGHDRDQLVYQQNQFRDAQRQRLISDAKKARLNEVRHESGTAATK